MEMVSTLFYTPFYTILPFYFGVGTYRRVTSGFLFAGLLKISRKYYSLNKGGGRDARKNNTDIPFFAALPDERSKVHFSGVSRVICGCFGYNRF